MRNKPLFAFVVVALLAAILPATPVEAQGEVEYELIVDCPGRTNLNAGANTGPRPCPVQAVDGQDMMGSPSIGVDIRNPNKLVMASLHGMDGDGPSRRSRSGGVFTTFSSTTHGASWNDRPFGPPREVSGAFGEHPQAVNDPYGHVYIGSLYARPTTSARGPNAQYDYVIGAQKFENLDSVIRNQIAGTYNVQFLDPFIEDNAITQYWYIFDPRVDLMLVVWHEKPQGKAQPNATPPKHVIGYTWTTMAMKSKYIYTPNEYLIGPCASSTNPVWSEGWIYVGCTVDLALGAFPWNPKAHNGGVELFRFKPDDEAPQYLGSSPVIGGSPKLGVRSDGRLALFSTQPDKAGKNQLVGTFGKYKGGMIDWNELINYSPKIPRVRVDERILESAIQDLEYREYSGAVHLILKERVTYTSLVSADQPLAAVAAPQFRKTIVAIDERHGWLANYNFDIGNLDNRTDPVLAAGDELLYDDLSDDIVQLPPRNYTYKGKPLGELYSREFVAIGDYGIVQFAEIIEITDLRPPGVPPVGGVAVALAAPSLALTPSAVLLPLAGTSFAGLLAFALLANRRKNPLAAYSKGEK